MRDIPIWSLRAILYFYFKPIYKKTYLQIYYPVKTETCTINWCITLGQEWNSAVFHNSTEIPNVAFGNTLTQWSHVTTYLSRDLDLEWLLPLDDFLSLRLCLSSPFSDEFRLSLPLSEECSLSLWSSDLCFLEDFSLDSCLLACFKKKLVLSGK